MEQKEKPTARLKTALKNSTFDGAETLLEYSTFNKPNRGKTSGSRVKFKSEIYGATSLHKPYPQKEPKAYQAKQLAEKLEQERLI